MAGASIVYIPLRDNPGYLYSQVLSAINYNFQLVSGGTGGGSGTGATTYIVAGTNILTAGTTTSPIVSTVSSPIFNALTLSGVGSFAAISATSLNSGALTRTSSSQLLFNEFNSSALHGDITYSASATDGLLRWAGKSRFASLSATTLSGETIYSGATTLSSVIDRYSSRIKAGSNIITGGTPNNQTISTVTSPSFTNISITGTATLDSVRLLDTRTIGVATLSSGSVTVNTSDIDAATTCVFLTLQNLNGPAMPSALYISNISDGVSFDINSGDPADNSDVAWMIVKH